MPITISRLAGWLLDHLQNGWANSVYTYLDIVGFLRDNIGLWDYYIIYYYYTIYYNYYNRVGTLGTLGTLYISTPLGSKKKLRVTRFYNISR